MVDSKEKYDDLLSVIVPVFDESDNLKPLVDSVLAVMKQEGYRFELVFVNDGSTDSTLELLHKQKDIMLLNRS